MKYWTNSMLIISWKETHTEELFSKKLNWSFELDAMGIKKEIAAKTNA